MLSSREQEILAYYASFMPPGMREEQTEVRLLAVVSRFMRRVTLYIAVGEEQQFRDQVREIRLESSLDKGVTVICQTIAVLQF